jgi:lipoate-protein ligase B
MTPQFIDLGLKNFSDAEKIQENFLEKRKSGLCNDVVLISQFYPVITLGRTAQNSDILVDKATLEKQGIEIYQVNRGGGVTLHLPGQLVIYPIIDLNNLKKDIRYFIRFLEDWIIGFLALYGIPAYLKDKLAGIWVKERKICFLGIGISRWVSFHGLSLNISPDLHYFSYINPCGLKNIQVTSLKEELKFLPDDEELRRNLKDSYLDTFKSEVAT